MTKSLFNPHRLALLLSLAGSLSSLQAADVWSYTIGATENWEAASWSKNGSPAPGGTFPDAVDDTVRLNATASSVQFYLQKDRTFSLLEVTGGTVSLRPGAISGNANNTLSVGQINITGGVLAVGYRNGSSQLIVHAGGVNVTGGNLSLGAYDLNGATYIQEWTSTSLNISEGRVAGVRNPGFTKIDLGAVQANGTLDLAWKGAGNGSTLFTSSTPYIIEAGSLSGGSTGLVTTSVTAADVAPRVTLWLKGTNTSPVSYDGVIEDGVATAQVALRKSGSGVQRITNDAGNTYSGGTTIEGGILLARSVTGSALGSGSVVVKDGGTLAASYRLRLAPGANESVIVESGGVLNAGYGGTAGISIVTLSGAANGEAPVLDMQAGAAFDFRVDVDNNRADLIRFEDYSSGDLLLAGNVLNITGLIAPEPFQTWKLFEFDADISSESWYGNGLVLGSGFDGIDARLIYESNAIHLQVIPEPGVAALLLAGLGLLGFRRVRGCRRSIPALITVGMLGTGAAWAGELTLAKDGRTAYTIVIPKDATEALRAAAAEFRRDFTESTGAEILLTEEGSAAESGPVISLGETEAARQAGITSDGIADEGFRIVTKGEDLFILGPDTAEGRWTSLGGTSQGTANGVYTFLEQELGVRWLMPGEIGRDVPAHAELKVGPLDHTEAPGFIWRTMSHIFDYSRNEMRQGITQWAAQQKLGSSIRFEYNHNWDWLRTEKNYYKDHPEWFAMINGVRKRPKDKYFKIETTDQNLVRHFAHTAIETLKKDPRPNTYSISPADSRGWSESPESKALYDPPYIAEGMDGVDPTGEIAQRQNQPVMSSLILKWYHDVASIVEKEYPEGRLAGFLYGDYVWPPSKADMKLPSNFTPVLCGPNYGYVLYGEVYKKRFRDVIRAWSKVAPDTWFYYDLPNQFFWQKLVRSDARFPGGAAIITPPAIGILDTVFTELVNARIKGAYLFSESTWSNSALANYLNAKLLWNPRLKAGPLQTEWLQRAYGEKAGAAMENFYTRLDGIFAEYAKTHTINLRLQPDYLRDLYAANFSELESLFMEADRQPMTERQRARLDLIKENLIVLRWRLVNGGMLAADQPGSLKRGDLEVARVLERSLKDFHHFPGVIPPVGGRTLPRFSGVAARKIQVVSDAKVAQTAVSLSGVMPSERYSFLVHAAKDGLIKITPQQVHHDVFFGVAMVFKRGEKEPVVAQILIPGRTMEIPAKAGDAYLVVMPQRGPVAAELKVEGATAAKGFFDSRTSTLKLATEEDRSLYVYAHSPAVIQSGDDVILKAGTFPIEVLKREMVNAQELSLNEGWNFATGQKAEAALPADKEWVPIQVGEAWQKQGFSNHVGTGWYTMRFPFAASAPAAKALLYFEAVDGNAEVWLNGTRIGEHRLGANYAGWNMPFYLNATAALKPGENELVVRVEKDIEVAGVTGGVKLIWSQL